jgi:hypothetical protein
MNLIAHTVATLKPSLAWPRSLTEYSRARAVHPALARYASPLEVLDALAASSGLSLPERDAIVLPLLVELRATRHALWEALLLTVYEPMLYGIAKRTQGVDHPDAQQGALAGFVSAIRSVRIDPPPRLLSLTLRFASERVAFAQGTLPGDEPDVIALEDAEGELDPRDMHDAIEEGDQMAKVLRALVDLFGDERTAREVLDVLVHARTGRGPLVTWVDETYAALSRKRRDAILTRLFRQRARALVHLHRVFGADLDHEIERSVA